MPSPIPYAQVKVASERPVNGSFRPTSPPLTSRVQDDKLCEFVGIGRDSRHAALPARQPIAMSGPPAEGDLDMRDGMQETGRFLCQPPQKVHEYHVIGFS